MELKANLIKEERSALLKRFRGPQFKRIAKVLVGSPPKEMIESVHAEMLKAKQEKLDAEFQGVLKKRELKRKVEERRKLVEQKRKEAAAEAKKAEAGTKKSEAEAAKKETTGDDAE